MISISKEVKEILESSPILKEVFELKIINLSALAEILKPKIEEKLLKKVSKNSIIVALQRLEKETERKKRKFGEKIKEVFKGKVELTVRTDLVELVFQKTKDFSLAFTQCGTSSFLLFTQGLSEIVVILEKSKERCTIGALSKVKLIKRVDNLSAISIKIPAEALFSPGIFYFILKPLALEGINVVEAASTFRELHLIFKKEDLEKAFQILRKNLL